MKKYLLTAALLAAVVFNSKAQPNHVKHVILIGVDGLGAYAIPQSKMPNLKKMMSEGSWSLKTRTVLPSSSAVNWASMIMGAGPTAHGYTEWGSKVPEIPSVTKTKYGLFPSVFSLIRDQKPAAKTAVVYSWGGIGPLIEKEAINFVVPGPDGDNDDFCADTTANIIRKEKPLLTFVHFSEPDNTGHTVGHNTPAYYAQLEKLDVRIGKILAAVKAAGIEKETVIILSADHGGVGKGHGGKSLEEVQIPWVVYGAGVVPNHEIQGVTMIYDTASTIAWLLRLKEPQSWRGKPVIEAFK